MSVHYLLTSVEKWTSRSSNNDVKKQVFPVTKMVEIEVGMDIYIYISQKSKMVEVEVWIDIYIYISQKSKVSKVPFL